jgi:hypothetical protein
MGCRKGFHVNGFNHFYKYEMEIKNACLKTIKMVDKKSNVIIAHGFNRGWKKFLANV